MKNSDNMTPHDSRSYDSEIENSLLIIGISISKPSI